MSDHGIGSGSRRRIVLLFAAAAVGAALLLSQQASAASFAAKASVTPNVQFLGDVAGTTYTFTVRNSGTTGTIGAVEIARSSLSRTVTACPTAPSGWTTERTDWRCRYRSAVSASDDLQLGQSSSEFSVTAIGVTGTQNIWGTWTVKVSRKSTFVSLVKAGPEPPGLGIIAHSFEVLEAVVDPGPVTPGAPCPTPAPTPLAPGSGGHTVVICGRNRTTLTLTPTASQSRLSGTLIGSSGTFASGAIVPSTASVVLGTWSGVVASSSNVGPGQTIVARIGSNTKRFSPSTTLTGYEIVNTPPVAQPTSVSTDEDTPVSIEFSASDVDGQATTFSVADAPDHGTLGPITPTGCTGTAPRTCTATVLYTPDGDYSGSDDFLYRANDGLADSTTASVDISINPVNDAPIVDALSFDLAENTANGGTVGTATFTDPDAGPWTYAITTGNTNGAFTIGSGTGEITVANSAALDFETTPSFALIVEVTDSGGPAASGSNTVTVDLTDVNEAPAVDAATFGVAENSPNATAVGTIAAADPDAGQTLQFDIIAGNSGGAFAIDTGTGAITVANSAALDFETTPSYSLTVEATDDGVPALSASATITVDVSNVNEAPVNTVPAGTIIAPAGVLTDIAGVSVSDVDAAGGDLSVAFGAAHGDIAVATNVAGGVGAADVTANGTGAVTVVGSLSELNTTFGASGGLRYRADVGYDGPDQIEMVTDDQGNTGSGGALSDTDTIDVTVPANAAPVADPGSETTDEDDPVVITLTASDPDDDALAFSIPGGFGPDHGGLSAITGVDCSAVNTCSASITYTPNADYHGPDGFTFEVDDGHGLTDTAGVLIDVTALNDPPTALDLTPTTIAENAGPGAAVGTLSTVDVDSGDGHTYSLVSGAGDADNASFEIVGDELRAVVDLDFEAQDTHFVRIRTTDTGLASFDRAFTISVTDVNEAPTAIALTSSSIDENSAPGDAVGTLTTTDPDPGDTFTYALVAGAGDDDNAEFEIVGDEVRAIAALNFETKSSYTVRVSSTDSGSLAVEQQFTISVNDVNEDPSDLDLSADSIDENSGANATIGTLVTTDVDAGDTHTYTLVAGAGDVDNGLFNISGDQLRENASFNFEDIPSYSVRIRTTDSGGLTYEESFTINVNDINDAPVADAESFTQANGNTDAIGNTTFALGVTGAGPRKDVPGTVLTGDTDEDQLPSPDTLTATFPASTANGTIVSSNPDGTFTYMPNAGFTGNDTFTYTLNDGEGGTDTATVTIEVANAVWYVDALATAPGTGQSTSPYTSLASLQGADLDESGETIFVYTGAYSTGIALESAQRLFGQPHGLVVDGTTLVAASGSAPVLSNGAGAGITLANDVEVQDIQVGGASGAGILGTSVTNATIGAGVDITGALGADFQLTGAASGTITFAGDVVNNVAGRSIDIANRTGGTVTLSGLVRDVTAAGPGTGIALTSNTGAVINMTGQLILSTGANQAFTATGGGTITATGAASTIATTSGTALSVSNTTIGAADLNFRSISTSGAATAILLNSTGTSGGLTVTGNGGTCTIATPTCTGGTISTGATGISLTSTRDVSLTLMAIRDFTDFGVRGNGVTNLTLANSVVHGTQGNDANADEAAVAIDGLTGTASITGSVVEGGVEDNLRIVNSSGTLNRLTISGSTFGHNSTADGSDAVLLKATGSAVMNVTVQNSSFGGARGDLLQTDAGGTAAMDVVISGNTFANTHAATAVAGGGVVVTTTSTNPLTYLVSGNSFTGADGAGLAIDVGGAGQVTNGRVLDNTVGVEANDDSGSAAANGIAWIADGGGTHRAVIHNNTVRQYNNHGILLQVGDALGNVQSADLTVTDNDVRFPGTIGDDFSAILLNHGTVASDNFTSCVDIGGAGSLVNNVTAGGKGAVPPNNADIRLRQRQATTVRLPGYGGANNDNTAVQNYLAARNTLNTVAAINSVPTGGGFTGGGACAQPPA